MDTSGSTQEVGPLGEELILSSGKREIILSPAMTNLAGTLGFSLEASHSLDLSRLGAFITNPISMSPRTPARPPRVLNFPGGFLLHTGHPNPGFTQILRRHRQRWAELPSPVIIHLLGEATDELREMTQRIEEIEAASAVEVGLGDSDPSHAAEMIGVAAQSELPIIANFPATRSEILAPVLSESGAVALSIGPPRGTIQSPEGPLVNGRLLGPGVFPLALRAVISLRSITDLPILASGGVYSQTHANTMIQAGADAVQFDGILWTEPEAVLAGS
ncbi:MAG: hypothetical protein GTO18_21545 [Anaerolineales bacterium]|nr:hypothetical protein [Anaerolineales bacterium]